jgi:hypothetical protein
MDARWATLISGGGKHRSDMTTNRQLLPLGGKDVPCWGGEFLNKSKWLNIFFR